MSVYIFVHEMKKVVLFLVFATSLAGCLSTTPTPASPTPLPTLTPTGTSNPTITPQLTATIAPTVTAIPTTIPVEGRLFFDMNGSGLPDMASFTYDPERLDDPRQPFQPDLLAAINNYVQAHPDLKKGDLVTIEEPALSAYKVCTADICRTTDKEGKFTISNPTGSVLTLEITDPNEGKPALEMGYINKWKGPVVVPAYTKDVDAVIMATLKSIPDCIADAAAQLCKQDADTLLVRDQTLNDTLVLPIGNGITVQEGQPNEVGLMQGYLTLPFTINDLLIPVVIWNGYDVCGEGPYVGDNIVSNYLGIKSTGNPYSNPPKDGQNDSHAGIDYAVPEGTLVVASLDGSINTGIRIHAGKETGELFLDINNYSMERVIDNGHLGGWLLNSGSQVFRGQILANSGKSGSDNIAFGRLTPQLHWDIAAYGENLYLNPFATLSDDTYPQNCKIMRSKNLWTVYNIMVFPSGLSTRQ